VRGCRFGKLWYGLCCLLLVSGCASRLPRTLAVHGSELDQGQAALSRFLEKACSRAVDADVRLGWQAYGQHETYPATLQAMAPSFLRLAVVDPLGRPFALLVTDGDSFSLVDNRHGEGYVGAMDSDLIHKYLPVGISSKELFFWLSGRISSRGLQVLSVRKAEQGPMFWYEVDYGDRLIHLLGLDKDCLTRHLVLDAEDRIMVDVRYTYLTDTTEVGQCAWPAKIEIYGKHSAAILSLELTRMYSFSPLQKKFFQVRFPAHFTVHRMQ